MNQNQMIEVIEFTDPVCTWCWGSEPLLRALAFQYGDELQVRFIMGGLVKDIRDFYDSYNDIGGDADHSNRQIARHWLEASEKHGMPVRIEGFRLFSDDHPSTYPQNIAYKAAQMENQKLADQFLRRIREASAAEAKQTNQQEVLIELASEVGLDLGQLLEHLADGSAEAAFKDDLRLLQKYSVRGFPTFLIRYGEKEMMVRSFQDISTFRTLIKNMTGDAVKPRIIEQSSPAIIQFIRQFGRVAPVEIQKAFDLSQEQTQGIIDDLKDQRLIKIIPAGNGFFIESSASPMSCGVGSDFCSVDQPNLPVM